MVGEVIYKGKNIGTKKRVSYSYRTATTTYPCSIPRLGEFCRSWSYKTYPSANVQKNVSLQKNIEK